MGKSRPVSSALRRMEEIACAEDGRVGVGSSSGDEKEEGRWCRVMEEKKGNGQEEAEDMIPVLCIHPGRDCGEEVKKLRDRTTPRGWEWRESTFLYHADWKLPRAREALLILDDVGDFFGNPDVQMRITSCGCRLVHLAEIRLGRIVVLFTLKRNEETGLYAPYRWIPSF